MAEQQKQTPSATPAGASTERAADLAELLAHVTTSWDDQRRGLSRQLHDSLGSSLTALTMHLTLLTQKLPQDQALLDRAAQMKQLLLNVIENNRNTQLTLWNDKLEFLGVTVALKELGEQFAESRAVPVQVRLSLPDDEVSCARPYGVALLRTLEEGLANIAAHTEATEIDIILDDNDEEITLTIKDNGAGPRGAIDGDLSKHGLRTLRERAAALGGSVTLSAGQPGTTLTMHLPRRTGTSA
jgi:signal transduction histidine kinase